MIPRYDIESAISLQRYNLRVVSAKSTISYVMYHNYKNFVILIFTLYKKLLFRIPLQSPNSRPNPTIVRSKLSNDHLDYTNTQSGNNSTVTSVNSLSSLLKEKLQWTIPQALRNNAKNQNAEFRYVPIFFFDGIKSDDLYYLTDFFFLFLIVVM